MFIDFLITQKQLEKVVLNFPSRKETRYIYGEVSPFELAKDIRKPSYFSHYTALFLHDLTEQIPKTIYVNQEQSPKPPSSSGLEQKRIDFAFQRAPRQTKNKAKYKDTTIVLLSGKFTGELGVSAFLFDSSQEKTRTTNLERTIIDICVRPFYSGGIFEVAKAYALAKNKISVEKVIGILKELNYVYPYHQAIGFLMEKAGYSKKSLELIQNEFQYEFDFYLTHQIKKPEYSQKWRLFYPRGF